MSHLLARIMLALLMLPAATVAYILSFFVTGEWLRWRDWKMLLAGGVISTTVVVVWWTALWWRTVRWTPIRLGRTAVATAAVVVVGVGTSWLVGQAERDFGWFLWAPLTSLLWLIATVLIWRDTNQERAARLAGRTMRTIVCPRCGYNLTGLRQTTCPECGATFTIDELLAEQPDREGDALGEGAAAIESEGEWR